MRKSIDMNKWPEKCSNRQTQRQTVGQTKCLNRQIKRQTDGQTELKNYYIYTF